MSTLTVELGARSYPIEIGRGLLSGGYDFSASLPGPNATIVSDDNVAPLYLEALRACIPGRRLHHRVLPAGEAHKTLAGVSEILDALVEAGGHRDTAVIALGGGVVGDMAGFAAAVYQRGVAFVQVPTTLLAQVDSSVGGKTGVNHPAGKNLIGAFHQPSVVVIDTDTLATLPEREFRAGLAEVIKYGALGDAGFFAWLEDNMPALLAHSHDALAHAIRRCCELKAEIVAADERERGRRALLNLGHTFGHAIETCTGYGEWLHGEAVAAGMVMAARTSGLAGDALARLTALLEAAGLPVAPPPVGADRLRRAMQLDKKVLDDRLRLVLLDDLGAARVTADYDEAALNATLRLADA